MAEERLQKVMASAGVASRRACEELIAAGKVTVNGAVVREMGTKVDPERDVIEIAGRQIKPKATRRYSYIMLYKPPGYLSVFDDPRGRQGLEALVKSNARLYPVGRLDADSEGLLLLTDDGDLTLRLSHPRYEHVKGYFVLVDKLPGTDTLARFRRGVDLGGGETASAEWRPMEKAPSVQPLPDAERPTGVWVHVFMRQGKKRQIRRMAAVEKLFIRRLIRVQIGPLMLDRTLQPGQHRPLTRMEIQRLRMATRPAVSRGNRPSGSASRGNRPSGSASRGSRPSGSASRARTTSRPGERSRPPQRGGPGRAGPTKPKPATKRKGSQG